MRKPNAPHTPAPPVLGHAEEGDRGLGIGDNAGSLKDGVEVAWLTAGWSVEGRAIQAAVLGAGDGATLVLGGMHGNEPEGAYVTRMLIELLGREPSRIEGSGVVLLPETNPDGLLRPMRGNANRVDINRNFPTRDWVSTENKGRYYSGPSAASEPETRVVLWLLAEFRPSKIISIHFPLHQINYDGPAEDLAREMARCNGYPVQSFIGYPTPGSLGTFAGRERGVPVITLELPPVSRQRAWIENRDALLAAIRFRARPCR
jgi:murein peptide amidase A